jgi:hypothetical protein
MGRMGAKAPTRPRAGTASRPGLSGLVPRGTWARVALVALWLALVADWVSIWFEPIGAQPDTKLYHEYGLGFVQHHSLPVEYPVLSVVAFLLTMVPSVPHSEVVFGAWMLMFVLVAWVVVSREVGAVAGLALLAYLVLGEWATVLERYDIVPALCVLLAFIAVRRGAWNWAYLLLALGFLLKLFPVFLVPLVVLEHVRSRRDARLTAWNGVLVGLGCFVVLAVGGFGLGLFLDPAHGLSPFLYAAARPLDVSSVPGSLLWLGSLFGSPVHGEAVFSSFNIVGSWSRPIEVLSSVALVGGLAVVWWRVWAGRIDAGRAWIATLGVLIVSSKVFSAQYLIWLFPVVAVVEGFSGWWLIVAVMTSVVFPILFILGVTHSEGVRLDYAPGLLAAIAARNFVLVGVVSAGIAGRVIKPIWNTKSA